VAGSTNTGLSATQDSLYAYTAASDATADHPTTYLSMISLGNAPDTVPAPLSTGQSIVFNTVNDSAYYSRSHSNQSVIGGFLGEINNAANWTQGAASTANNVPDFSNFTAGIDLSLYVRVGRFDLPEPTRTTPPLHSLLAQEASGVTYDWDTDTLF